MVDKKSETRVDSKRVETIFDEYNEGKYIVNRRYQRKLVWSAAEKENLIDSILQGIPIPLILVAEPDIDASKYDIIDGLQRLEAIVSFIENRYPYDGAYFDLEAIATTKYLLDQGVLHQQTPKLSREYSLKVAKYELPFSVYESGTAVEVDETFRRINSSGRRLSLQEVRQAGVMSKVSDLVKDISSSVRGDQNAKIRVSIDDMRDLSFVWGFKEGDRGINVDEVFWVKQGILRRDDLRSSLDEQIILDIVLDVFLASSKQGIINLSSDTRSEAYDDNTEIARVLIDEINKSSNAINLKGAVLRVNNLLGEFAGEESSVGVFLGKATANSIGRYYHVVFMALYQLIYVDRMEVKDSAYISNALRGYFKSRDIHRGGRWTSQDRSQAINALKGVIRDGFLPSSKQSVEATAANYNILVDDFLSHGNEHALFELKAGLFGRNMENMSGKELRKALKERFDDFLKTATAMTNTSPGEEKRVMYFGIVEDDHSAKVIQDRYGIPSFVPAFQDGNSPFRIVGIDHELKALSMDADELIRMFSNRIQESSVLPDKASEYRKLLASSLTTLLVRSDSGESRLVLALRPPKFAFPVSFNGTFYERIGARNSEIKGSDIFSRYEEFKYQSDL